MHHLHRSLNQCFVSRVSKATSIQIREKKSKANTEVASDRSDDLWFIKPFTSGARSSQKHLFLTTPKRINASFLVFLQEAAFQAEAVVTSVGVVAKLCHDHALCTRQSFDQPFS